MHSPTWDGEGTFERLEAIGRPTVLFAPNHFHHLSLPRFRQKWPDAPVIASTGARPRLQKQGHQNLAPLEAAATLLPAGVSFVEPPGLKNGEAWLTVDGEGGRTWIVCDAFFNQVRPVRGFMGIGLRWAKIIPGLSIGQPFRWFGIRDEPVYRAWLLDRLRAERPRRLIVSHGEPLIGDEVADRMIAVVEHRLRG